MRAKGEDPLLAWIGLGAVGLMAAWSLWIPADFGTGWPSPLANVLVNNEYTFSEIQGRPTQVFSALLVTLVIAAGFALVLGKPLFGWARIVRSAWIGILGAVPIAAVLYFWYLPDCRALDGGGCMGRDVDLYWPWLALGIQGVIGGLLLGAAAIRRRTWVFAIPAAAAAAGGIPLVQLGLIHR